MSFLRLSPPIDDLGGRSLALLQTNITVYGVDALSGKPIVGVIYLHGRLSRASGASSLALIKTILDSHRTQNPAQDILLFSFDQRNHGLRIADKSRSFAYVEDKFPDSPNVTHAPDMYMMVAGAAQDVTMLIDFAPMYLFPDAKHSIVRWAMTGISLGGHATWHALTKEPRISVAVPIIGGPDIFKLVKHRADAYAHLFPPGTPLIPAQLESFSNARMRPSDADLHAWTSKSILAIQGELDNVVVTSLTDVAPTIEKLKALGANAHIIIEPGVGHAVTPSMSQQVADFILANAFSVERL